MLRGGAVVVVHFPNKIRALRAVRPSGAYFVLVDISGVGDPGFTADDLGRWRVDAGRPRRPSLTRAMLAAAMAPRNRPISFSVVGCRASSASALCRSVPMLALLCVPSVTSLFLLLFARFALGVAVLHAGASRARHAFDSLLLCKGRRHARPGHGAPGDAQHAARRKRNASRVNRFNRAASGRAAASEVVRRSFCVGATEKIYMLVLASVCANQQRWLRRHR